MRRTLFRHILLANALCLTACFGGGNDEAPAMISMAARNGFRWSYELMTTGTVEPLPPLRPSAMLGPYVAAFLSLPTTNITHAAVSGVLTGTSFLYEDAGILDESYALLVEMGLTLQVELNDHLNRALDRRMALDAYREGLIDVSTRSQEHLELLETRLDEADAEVREIRRRSTQVQRNLNSALRDKDYATASSHQSELSKVQGELAVASSQQKELRNIINLFEDSLDLAAERLVAIDANREALIAGVTVIDIPGADDLGVLEKTGFRRRRADPKQVFGPAQPVE